MLERGAQEAAEALHNLRVDGREICFFGRVSDEIVELKRRQRGEIRALGFEPLARRRGGWTPAAGAGPEKQFPRTGADGKAPLGGVMDQ